MLMNKVCIEERPTDPDPRRRIGN